MAYDALNQVTSVQEPFGLALTYAYDSVGNQTLRTDSLGGTLTSVYDSADRLTKQEFSSPSGTLSYDLAYNKESQVTTLTRYSDAAGTTLVGTSVYTYNEVTRQDTIPHSNSTGTVLAAFTYTYDADYRLTTEADNGAATTYSYDSTSQLTSVVNSAGTTTYSYDSNGNRNSAGYSTTANQISTDGTWTYTYDNAGNLVEKSMGPSATTWYYTYDNNNDLLTAVEKSSPGGTTLVAATYTYDVFGELIEEDTWTQAAGNNTTKFAYDNGTIWATLNGSNQLEDRYFYDGNSTTPVARLSSGGAVSWYLTDEQGSVVNLVNSTGTLQDTITYDAYGNVTNETNPSYGDMWKYDGYQYDAATGLYRAGSRELSASDGVWLQQDPAGLLYGPNPYEYVGNDPTSYIDPTGQCGLLDGLQEFAQNAQAAAGNLIQQGQEQLQNGIQAAQELGQQALGQAQEALGNAQEAAGELLDQAQQLAQAGVEQAQQLAENLQAGVGELLDQAGEQINNAQQAAGQLLEDVQNFDLLPYLKDAQQALHNAEDYLPSAGIQQDLPGSPFTGWQGLLTDAYYLTPLGLADAGVQGLGMLLDQVVTNAEQNRAGIPPTPEESNLLDIPAAALAGSGQAAQQELEGLAKLPGNIAGMLNQGVLAAQDADMYSDYLKNTPASERVPYPDLPYQSNLFQGLNSAYHQGYNGLTGEEAAQAYAQDYLWNVWVGLVPQANLAQELINQAESGNPIDYGPANEIAGGNLGGVALGLGLGRLSQYLSPGEGGGGGGGTGETPNNNGPNGNSQ